jgi:hypothetical protein
MKLAPHFAAAAAAAVSPASEALASSLLDLLRCKRLCLSSFAAAAAVSPAAAMRWRLRCWTCWVLRCCFCSAF